MLRPLSLAVLAAACTAAGAETAADRGAEPWVRRQQPVVAESRVGDVVVELPALALADGREGDVVQVRLASGRPIRPGRVTAPGRVSL